MSRDSQVKRREKGVECSRQRKEHVIKQRKGPCRQRTVQFSMSGVQCEGGRGKQWLEK